MDEGNEGLTMNEIIEYDFYQAALAITLATTRPDGAPSVLFVAGTLHNEWTAKIRAELREKKDAIAPYLPKHNGEPIYSIIRIQPAGSARSVDADYMLEVTRMRFDLGISIRQDAWCAGELKVLAIERNIEKAVKDLFEAHKLPTTVIPGDSDDLGETYVDIMVELGPATNQGAIPDPGV